MGRCSPARRVTGHLPAGRPIWVHLDLDVLDAAVLPAVDSPGTPGLTFEQLTWLLSRLLSRLRRTGRILGVDVTIYDPHLAPDHTYPAAIIDCVAAGLQGALA